MNTNRIGEFERDLAFGSVAADTMSFEYYEDELKYAFKDYLYELLKQNDSLLTLGLPSDSVFQRFFTHMDSSLCFLMQSMFATLWTILFNFKTLRVGLLILFGRIIS